MVVFYILILCKGRCLDPPIGESKTIVVVLISRLQTRSLPIESAFEKKGRALARRAICEFSSYEL